MAHNNKTNQPPPPYSGGTADPGMPTSYNSAPPTYIQPTPRAGTINSNFVTSPDGIIIAVEMVMSFCLFVTAASYGWFAIWGGGGFIIFVGVTTWLTDIAWYLLHLFMVFHKLGADIPLPTLEFVYTGVVAALFLICASIATSKWGWVAAVNACAMFGWFGLAIYAADTVRRIMSWHASGMPSSVRFSSTGSRTTTTVSTTSTSRTGTNITTEPHY